MSRRNEASAREAERREWSGSDVISDFSPHRAVSAKFQVALQKEDLWPGDLKDNGEDLRRSHSKP